jgi:putative ABC transport system permease protein
MMTSLRNLLRAVFRRDALNREMNDELRAHLELSTARLMERGLSRGEAEAAARREFGNVSVVAEQGRDARGASWVEVLRGDLRYAARSLRASPTFTLVAVLSLAIGIGANTAIFSLINALMLRSLPVAHPEELLQVTLVDSVPARPDARGMDYLTYPMWDRLRDQTAGEATYAIAGGTRFNLASGGEVRYASAMWVNGDFFNTLGVRPLQGRLFSAGDDRPGCAPTVVISEAFWQSQLGSAEGVIGQPLKLNGKPYSIIGILPAEFFGVEVGTSTPLYIPLCAEPIENGAESALLKPTNWWLQILVRPRPGVAPERLAARMRQVSRGVLEASASPRFDARRRAGFVSQKFAVSPARHGFSELRARYSKSLIVLMGMVALVLMISCANVANLMLARGTARSREMAIRVAIGASRSRLVRQTLTEGLLLAAIGTALGLGLALWTSRLLVMMLGSTSAIAGGVDLELGLDRRVIAFTIASCLGTVVLFALAPALRSTRVDPQAAMKSGGRGIAEARNRFRIGKSLVVAQSALALILVMAAGLLGSTFQRLTKAPAGFNAEGVLFVTVGLGRTNIPAPARADYIQRMRQSMTSLAGVRSVSAVSIMPISGSGWNDFIEVEGGKNAAAEDERMAWFNEVDTAYFSTMATRLIAGRDFGAQDTPGSPKVAVVTEAMAKRFFPGTSPVGKTYYTKDMGVRGERVTIIGVVENSRYRSLREDVQPIVYLTFRQRPPGFAANQLVIRATSVPQAISGIKALAASLDPSISLRFTSFADQVARSLSRERMLAILSTFFGVLALALAMTGLYGVMAYTVARRRVEIGIRIALGAVRGRVIRMILGDVGALVGAGILIGGVVAYASVKVLESLLYGIDPHDPWMLAGAAAVLALAALGAGAVPALRAASLRPVAALRED